MAGFLGRLGQSIVSAISPLLGRKPVAPPKPSSLKLPGELGWAVGEGNKPKPDRSNRRQLPSSQVEGFVYDGDILIVNSSNVAAAQYNPIENKMMVEFLGKGGRGGASYLYSNVSIDEAIAFAQAQSKGGFVWDHFRVRGSRTAHRKPYVKIGRDAFPKLDRNAPSEGMFRDMLGGGYAG